MWAWSLGREHPLKEEMATYSSILAWRIPWTEEPDRLQSIGSQRVRHDWSDLASKSTVFHLFIYVPDVMGLFYSHAKPKIPLLHRDQYVTRSWKSGGGHAGHDGQPEGKVISFVHDYTVLRNTLKVALRNWQVTWTWNLWTYLQTRLPLGWAQNLGFSAGRATILWKNKKFMLLKFHRRILRPKHISLHLQGQSLCFTPKPH